MKILQVFRKAFKLAWCLAYHERYHENFVAGSDMACAHYTVCKKCDERFVRGDALVSKDEIVKRLENIAKLQQHNGSRRTRSLGKG